MKSSSHRKNAYAALAAGLAAGFAAIAPGGAAAAPWAARDAGVRQEIVVSPGIGGLRLPEEVQDFPVAVRLSSQTLSFDDLGRTADGLSVYDAEGALIPHYVESYDPVARIATLWLGFDALNPAEEARTVYMYYGDGEGGPSADPASVFSAYRGFFDFSLPAGEGGEAGGAGNGDAVDPSGVAVPNLAGGGAFEDLLTTPGFAGASLQLFEGASHPLPDDLFGEEEAGGEAQAFTLSFWWRSAENGADATLLSGDTALGPLAVRLAGGRPVLTLPAVGPSASLEGPEAEGADAPAEENGGGEQGDENGAEEGGETPADAPNAIAARAALAPGVWHHLALAYDGEIVSFFVDGERAGERRRADMGPLRGLALGALAVRDEALDSSTDADAGTGADIDTGAQVGEAPPDAEDAAAPALLGLMDNLAIAGTRLSDVTIFAASQADAGRGLVSFGPEEERAGLFDFSYMVTVLTNVTLEGWVVIAICMTLLTIAILVMTGKSAQISRVEGANRKFSDEFDRRFSRELLAVQAEPTARHYRASTLAELYDTAAAEIDEAAAEVANEAGPEFDTGRVAALRARLNRKLIEQDHRLSRRLVLLTLAIAGGPFLGLLGTVIGVMITFAAIAAEGSVDITAVGPGVAAALLTTVAGLAVAIPSLFGYNIILPRIKMIKADARSFAETLVARISQRFGTRA